MRKYYYYEVNGVTFLTKNGVNNHIKSMDEKPFVIKVEKWDNERKSKRIIKVKGKPGNYTIS